MVRTRVEQAGPSSAAQPSPVFVVAPLQSAPHGHEQSTVRRGAARGPRLAASGRGLHAALQHLLPPPHQASKPAALLVEL